MELTPAAALAAAAARKGWSGEELADRIQVSRSLVATWLDGSAEPPERFHRRLLETLDLTDEERAALTGATPTAEAPTTPTEPESAPATRTEPVGPASVEPAGPPASEPEPPSRRSTSMTAGRAIQEARRRKGWTTRELASAIHYERGEIEAWEDDAAEPWSFAIRQMMEVLDFTAAETAALGKAEP